MARAAWKDFQPAGLEEPDSARRRPGRIRRLRLQVRRPLRLRLANDNFRAVERQIPVVAVEMIADPAMANSVVTDGGADMAAKTLGVSIPYLVRCQAAHPDLLDPEPLKVCT